MQKLEERNTYTPTDIPHVSGNCDWILNRPETSVHAVSTYGAAIRVCDVNWHNGLEETLSVSGLKTSSNNSDAALIATEHAKQNKLDSHIKLIEKVKQLLPITKIDIEVAAFDIQKIKNPGISGIEYQNGVQKDSWNAREYVLHRDNHICQHCKTGNFHVNRKMETG